MLGILDLFYIPGIRLTRSMVMTTSSYPVLTQWVNILSATMLIATAAEVWTICIMLIAIWRAIGRLDKTSVSHEVCKEKTD